MHLRNTVRLLANYSVTGISYAARRRPRALTYALAALLTLPVLNSNSSAALGPGTALRFDGVSEYVQVQNPAGTGSATTIEFWMRPLLAAPSGTLFMNGDFLRLRFDSVANQLCFHADTPTAGYDLRAPIVPSDFTDGLWHHVAVTY